MFLSDIFFRTKPKAESVGANIPRPEPDAHELDTFRRDAAEGNNDGVEAFLQKYSGDYVDFVDYRGGKYGWSPLMLAGWWGHQDTVNILKRARSSSSLSGPS